MTVARAARYDALDPTARCRSRPGILVYMENEFFQRLCSVGSQVGDAAGPAVPRRNADRFYGALSCSAVGGALAYGSIAHPSEAEVKARLGGDGHAVVWYNRTRLNTRSDVRRGVDPPDSWLVGQRRRIPVRMAGRLSGRVLRSPAWSVLGTVGRRHQGERGNR